MVRTLHPMRAKVATNRLRDCGRMDRLDRVHRQSAKQEALGHAEGFLRTKPIY
jgi:hypothetical protein